MTDAEFMLHALSDGRWHSRDEIIEWSKQERGFGLTPHSRAPDLRKRGHVVETRLERDGRGRTLSFYRLALGETPASPEAVRDGTDGSTGVSPSAPSNPPRHHAPLGLSGAVSTDDDQGSRDGGVLLLFDSHDQARVVRGAYSEDAA